MVARLTDDARRAALIEAAQEARDALLEVKTYAVLTSADYDTINAARTLCKRLAQEAAASRTPGPSAPTVYDGPHSRDMESPQWTVSGPRAHADLGAKRGAPPPGPRDTGGGAP
jgi:hypothetical protein